MVGADYKEKDGQCAVLDHRDQRPSLKDRKKPVKLVLCRVQNISSLIYWLCLLYPLLYSAVYFQLVSLTLSFLPF